MSIQYFFICIIFFRRSGGILNGTYSNQQSDALGRYVSDDRYKAGYVDFSRLYMEIAVFYGLGLRLVFDFFLLRLDTGFKAYNPQEKKSRRWAITRPNFKDNFALHFAVGYPF